jgi:hypothetical protein
MSSNDNDSRPGFLPNGGGADATYGRNPEGIAYNKNGTLRKKRTSKTLAERQKEIDDRYKAMYTNAGRQALAAAGGTEFDKAAAKVRGAISAAKRAADLDTRLADLQRQIEEAPAEAERAQAYLDTGPDDALTAVNAARVNIGKAVLSHMEDTGAEPEGDDLQSIVEDNIPEGALDTINEAAANDWRGDEEQDDEDDLDD